MSSSVTLRPYLDSIYNAFNSPRGLMNQVMISRMRESNKSKIEDDVRKLQQICGKYVKKIRLEKEYFKEIRKDGMERKIT